MYERKSLRIGLVSGSGAFIGALVSLQIANYVSVSGSSFWFWLFGFVGMFLGGVFGYIAYDFRGFCRGIAEAWRSVARAGLELKSRSKYFVNTWIDINIAEVFGGFWLLLLVCLLGFIITRQDPFMLLFGGNPREIEAFVFSLVVFSQAISVTVSCGFAALMESEGSEENEEIPIAHVIAFFNPFSALFIRIPRAIIKAGRYAMPRMPGAIRVLGSFLKTAFILVHSDDRLVCAITAAFGAGFGHFAVQNALVGGVIGFFAGVAEFEIVSKRVLRIAR